MFRFDTSAFFKKYFGAGGNDYDVHQTQEAGVPLLSKQYRYHVVIAPGGADLAAPCDAIVCATDGTVTVIGSDDAGGPTTTITVKSGVVYEFSCSRITASTAGAVVGLYHRKPA